MLNPPTYEDDLTVRISGTIGDPNELAALLVAGVVFAGVLTAITKDRPPLRIAAGGANCRDLDHQVVGQTVAIGVYGRIGVPCVPVRYEELRMVEQSAPK